MSSISQPTLNTLNALREEFVKHGAVSILCTQSELNRLRAALAFMREQSLEWYSVKLQAKLLGLNEWEKETRGGNEGVVKYRVFMLPQEKASGTRAKELRLAGMLHGVETGKNRILTEKETREREEINESAKIYEEAMRKKKLEHGFELKENGEWIEPPHWKWKPQNMWEQMDKKAKRGAFAQCPDEFLLDMEPPMIGLEVKEEEKKILAALRAKSITSLPAHPREESSNSSSRSAAEQYSQIEANTTEKDLFSKLNEEMSESETSEASSADDDAYAKLMKQITQKPQSGERSE